LSVCKGRDDFKIVTNFFTDVKCRIEFDFPANFFRQGKICFRILINNLLKKSRNFHILKKTLTNQSITDKKLRIKNQICDLSFIKFKQANNLDTKVKI